MFKRLYPVSISKLFSNGTLLCHVPIPFLKKNKSEMEFNVVNGVMCQKIIFI